MREEKVSRQGAKYAKAAKKEPAFTLRFFAPWRELLQHSLITLERIALNAKWTISSPGP